MSEKRCELCGKQAASVRLTEIAESQVTKRFICRACAAKRGLLEVPVVPVAPVEALFKLVTAPKPAPSPAPRPEREIPALECGACGLSFAEFHKKGRLGCASCYAAFESELVPILRRIHAHTRHAGKSPHRDARRAALRRRADDLRQELERAVRAEDYERAAGLRDEMRQLEQEQSAAVRRAVQAAASDATGRGKKDG